MSKNLVFSTIWTIFCAFSGTAQTNIVQLDQTIEFREGDYAEKIIIKNGGVFLMNGGAVGTNPSVFEASVEVESGGRFVMNDGKLKYFENRGTTELYGGTVDWSSENYSYLKLAGSDIGSQLLHSDGILDLYGVATNHASFFEIYSDATSASPIINIYAISNSLSPGEYGLDDLDPLDPNPYGTVHHSQVNFWSPYGNFTANIDYWMNSNWTGRIYSRTFTQPPPLNTDIDSAVQVRWTAEVGRTYQVQFTTNMMTDEWHNLGLPSKIDDVVGIAFDSVSHTPRFYRVIIRH